MRVDDAIVEELVRQGVTQVFGLMGEDTAKLILRLPPAGIAYLSSRHESGSVGMADGYSRMSGDVGVAVLSRGPGLTNGITALTTAARNGSRVLVLASDTPDVVPRSQTIGGTARLSHKFVDQGALCDAIGVTQATLHDAASISADLSAAFEWVRANGAMVVNLPMNLLAASFDDDVAQAVHSAAVPKLVAPRPPDPAEIAQVADLLETTWAASRPVVLAGRGAVRAGAAADIAAIGERIGAVMATTLPAWSMFKDGAYDAGIMGTFTTPVSSELFMRSDVLLSFGASLNRLTTFGNTLFPKALVVHFDDDEEAFGKHVPAELVVHGDVGLSAAALLDELVRRGHSNQGYRTSDVADHLASEDLRSEVRDKSDDEGIDPRVLSIALDEAITTERALIVDAGHYMGLLLPFMSISGPESLAVPLDFGAIGSAAPIATGAALARPDRLTVLAAGDGGFMMIIEELDTAVRARVPLLVLVYNDNAYGAEVQLLDVAGLPTEMARFDDRSFAEIATAMGAEGMTIRTLDDVEILRKRLVVPLEGVLLVDCRITTAVQADFVTAVALVTGQPSK